MTTEDLLAEINGLRQRMAAVGDVCDLWQRRYDASVRHPTEIPIVPIDVIRRAMDGCECATWATDHCPKCLDGAS